MIVTDLGIKIECNRRNGKINLKLWKNDQVSGFRHSYQLTEENANKLINEIRHSLTNGEADENPRHA